MYDLLFVFMPLGKYGSSRSFQQVYPLANYEGISVDSHHPQTNQYLDSIDVQRANLYTAVIHSLTGTYTGI